MGVLVAALVFVVAATATTVLRTRRRNAANQTVSRPAVFASIAIAVVVIVALAVLIHR